MRKNILILILLLLLVYVCIFIFSPKTSPVYLSQPNQIFQEKTPISNDEILQTLDIINSKNNQITSIYLENMSIYLQQGRLKAKVYGFLAMEKDKKFRLIINHKLFGKEIDIGSNEESFWFWSKRMKPPYLHYANHKDLNKTFLRMALNPEWLLESLNVNVVDVKNIQTNKFKDYYSVFQPRVDSFGQPVTVVLLIDPKKQICIGRYLYNSDNQLIASAEYRNFNQNIPLNILIIWYEEQITLNLDLTNISVNQNLNSNYWIMPDINPRIDLSK